MDNQSTADLSASKERVASSFRGLISGAEDLLRSTAGATGEGVQAARSSFRDVVDRARDSMSDMESMAVDRYRQTTAATEDFVRSNPWQAVGIAVVAGVVLGFLASRR